MVAASSATYARYDVLMATTREQLIATLKASGVNGRAGSIADSLLAAYVIIPTADIPPTRDVDGSIVVDGDGPGRPPRIYADEPLDELTWRALTTLSLARRVEQIPQADAVEVDAITSALAGVSLTGSPRQIARRLRRAGLSVQQARP